MNACDDLPMNPAFGRRCLPSQTGNTVAHPQRPFDSVFHHDAASNSGRIGEVFGGGVAAVSHTHDGPSSHHSGTAGSGNSRSRCLQPCNESARRGLHPADDVCSHPAASTAVSSLSHDSSRPQRGQSAGLCGILWRAATTRYLRTAPSRRRCPPCDERRPREGADEAHRFGHSHLDVEAAPGGRQCVLCVVGGN
jgi:hypothetical protein